MTQTKAGAYETFLEDVRGVFDSTKDPRVQAERIAGLLSKLLKSPGWLEERLGDAASRDLYLDDSHGHPEGGFKLMCSRQSSDKFGAPHDHGAGWVVYGVYQGGSEHQKYHWVAPDGDWTSPRLEEKQRIALGPGQAAFFLPGEIHATRSTQPGNTIIVRVESQDLDLLWRHRYNRETGTVAAYKG